MRVAVIAQQASAGGGTRFLRPLVNALAEAYDDMQLTVFVSSDAAAKFGASAGFLSSHIAVEGIDPLLRALPQEPPGSLGGRLRRRIAQLRGRDHATRLQGARIEFARRLVGFDVVYLSWPFFFEPIDFDAATVGTFHDFNYKHGFGTLDDGLVAILESEVPRWLDRCDVAVTSAACIDQELMSYYGERVKRHLVIRLSTLRSGTPSRDVVQDALVRHGLPSSYVVCPSNTSEHKNLAGLFRAYAQVRRLGGPPLVLIGNGTDKIAGGEFDGESADPGLTRLRDAFAQSELVSGRDVLSLGFVSDEDADSVIAGATMLVAPSLYEAGSGPALDAWSLGTPVAMSSIPPFLEHLEFLGVEAVLFDPDDPEDIAGRILELLSDEGRRAQMATASLEAMSRYTWADVAAGYRQAFELAIAVHEDAE